MGFLQNIFGFGGLARDIGGAIKDNTEVFHVNETEEMKADAENFQSALAQYQAEFQNAPKSWFSQGIDGLNRLPRPFMALGTISLFIFALYDPDRFSVRMVGLQEVPDPLWWLMGAIVSFYFGARELHYVRTHKAARQVAQKIPQKVIAAPKTLAEVDGFQWAKTSDNPAIADWLALR